MSKKKPVLLRPLEAIRMDVKNLEALRVLLDQEEYSRRFWVGSVAGECPLGPRALRLAPYIMKEIDAQLVALEVEEKKHATAPRRKEKTNP